MENSQPLWQHEAVMQTSGSIQASKGKMAPAEGWVLQFRAVQVLAAHISMALASVV